MIAEENFPNILYLDDDGPLLHIFERQMRRYKVPNLKVHLASEPQAALELLAETPMHVLIADYDLGRHQPTGIEFFEQAKQIVPDAPRILITGYSDLKVAIQAINVGVFGFVVKPWDGEALRTTILNAVEHARLKRENEYLTRALQAKMAELEQLNQGLELEISERTKALLDGLTHALDYRDTETLWHSRRVSRFSSELAKRMGLDGRTLLDVEWGALLHDLGKIGVPDQILLKPSKLTDEEWVVMKRHPVLGYGLLRGIKFLQGAAQIVLQHHEHWDGHGYTQGLSGCDIVIGARIFAVIDTYDALTSERPYRRAQSHEYALKEVHRVRGSQLDPDVVDIFLSFTEEEWQFIRGELQERPRVTAAAGPPA